MRLTKALDGKSMLDRFMEKNSTPEPKTIEASKSFADERVEAERKAIEHENKRKLNAEKFPNVGNAELKEGFKLEATDKDKVVVAASNMLKKHLGSLVGKGGFDLDLDDVRVKKSHNDVVDDSLVTDEALISFAAKFTLPGTRNTRTAKFVVSYNESDDTPFKVESNFFDENDSEYVLNSDNLSNFLKAEKETMANSEKPLIFYNYDLDTYEVVNTPSNTDAVVAKLKAEGYNINTEWIDACHDPKNFGKLCYVAAVEHKDVDNFKKLASAVPDNKWFDRTLEKGDYDTKKDQKDWPDRALETGSYDKKGAGDKWPERALEGGKEGDSSDYGNPYPTDAKMLSADASKKVEAKKSVIAKIDDLEKLLKS